MANPLANLHPKSYTLMSRSRGCRNGFRELRYPSILVLSKVIALAKILSSNFEKKQMYREIATIMFLSRFITPSFDVKKYHFFSSVITQETLFLLHRFASGLVRMKLFVSPFGNPNVRRFPESIGTFRPCF